MRVFAGDRHFLARVFDPSNVPNVPFALAVNTAASFTTNTNWQAYSGENTMSYFAQMSGLVVHNFVSAATGIAIAVALVRGLVREQAQSIGNFWADLTWCTLHLLLPLSILIAVVLTQQSVVQTFAGYPTASTIEGAQQQNPFGPIASQIAIKQPGTNGGGFLGQNSTYPFENLTPLTNFIEVFVIRLFRVRACLHVRTDGQRSPSGMGNLGGNVRSVPRRRRRPSDERPR